MKSYRQLIEEVNKWLGTTDHKAIHSDIQGDLGSIHPYVHLEEPEETSLDYYQGSSGYHYVNTYHRRDQNYPGAVQNHTKNLDSAIAKSKTEHHAHAWRGIDPYVVPDMNLKKGDTFHDKGFVSTSLNPAVAKTFSPMSDGDKREKHTFHIKVPKGSKALYVNNTADSVNPGEHELLLPRNSKFKYNGKTEHVNPLGIKHVIHHITHIPSESAEGAE